MSVFFPVLRVWKKISRFFCQSSPSTLILGQAGDPLPEGYVYYRQSFEYLKGEARNPEKNVIIKRSGRYAVRTEVQPNVFFESHNTDEEPAIEPFPQDRLILWETLTRTDCPSGWKRGKKHHNLRQIGVSVLNGNVEYWKKWSSHARRHRKKWLSQKIFSIQEVSLEDFVKGFLRSNKLPEWRDIFIELLERRSIKNKHHVKFFGILNESGTVVAGLAVLDLPDVSTSKHMIAFFDDALSNTSVNYGLIDHWHQHCLRKNICFLDFGIFWHPGDKKEFQGFSQFKSQFNIHYIVLLPELERWCKAGEVW